MITTYDSAVLDSKHFSFRREHSRPAVGKRRARKGRLVGDIAMLRSGSYSSDKLLWSLSFAFLRRISHRKDNLQTN